MMFGAIAERGFGASANVGLTKSPPSGATPFCPAPIAMPFLSCDCRRVRATLVTPSVPILKLSTLQPKWSYASALTRTRLPQFASLVPILGYAVLWGDAFQTWVMRFSVFGPPLLFSTLTRIYLLYLGGVCILVGLVIFWLFCPRPLRLYRSRREYVEAVRGDRDSIESGRAGAALAAVAHEFPPINNTGLIDVRQIHGIVVSDEEIGITKREPSAVTAGAPPPVLTAYYEVLDRRRRVLSACCLSFLTLGGFLFLLPSLEVFFMAIGHMWTHMGPGS